MLHNGKQTLRSICLTGHVDMINVTLGMLSACAPLSRCCGYPLMGVHHGDSLKGWRRTGSLNVRFITSEIMFCFYPA